MMNIEKIVNESENVLKPFYDKVDKISQINTEKVLKGFNDLKISTSDFTGTTGYGYDDIGRDKLDKLYSIVFNTEDAIVRHNIVNGTHAISIALYGILRPGDTLFSITGKPYDTLENVIGLSNNMKNDGSLRDFGIKYKQVELGQDFVKELDDKSIKIVYIQRSKGYDNRKTLSVNEINSMIRIVRQHSSAFVIVDNCYGEFTEISEPNADILIGSLIKNPGGGIAETGAYLAGTKRAIELASYRLTTVSVGKEVGSTLNTLRNMYKGLFFSPHVVAQSLKTVIFASYIFEKLGFDVSPKYYEDRNDIIQIIQLKNRENMCKFCEGIQSSSPIDSFLTPLPWKMPGYTDEVIMASGSFTQGSSIELSADGPIRSPYSIYLQGSLTFESGKYGIINAAKKLLKNYI